MLPYKKEMGALPETVADTPNDRDIEENTSNQQARSSKNFE